MRFLKWGILALASMTWLSCVVSLLPLFDDGYLVSEPGLLGTWKIADSADTWTFEKADGMEYLLTQRQAEYDLEKPAGTETPPKKIPGDTARFRARLGRLGAGLYLDLIPAEKDNPVVHNDLYNAHMVPGHTLARVWLDKDSLRIVFLDEDWLTEAIKDGRIALAHVETKGFQVLTAPTSGLQAFILKYGGDKRAFPLQSAEGLVRVK
ncbi:MAG: hypothetical protein M0C28_20690 [Candidatus Moduliflexus flocculans]|nr:hypothetical protein [Candidatus Moduliflexus flocculans]